MRVNGRPWRFESRGALGPKLQRPSLGALVGTPPEGSAITDYPVWLWDVRCPKALRMCISTFFLCFSPLNTLRFHGSFPKYIGSLTPQHNIN